MRWETTEMVPKITRHWKCDHCDKEVTGSNGCCGWSTINSCCICGKDFCHDHGEYFSEDAGEDYPHGVHACDDCKEEAERAWDYATETAGRYEDMRDAFKRGMNAMRFHERFANGETDINSFKFNWEQENEHQDD